jgi:hypothetical protein
MGLITFTQTSDQPYTRHDYKIKCSDGQSFLFDNYYDLMTAWMQLPYHIECIIEVIDKKKGFTV